MTATSPSRFVLRQLPLAARLVLAVFLLSVGFGYFSALVHLHFQLASPGQLLPEEKEVIDNYYGKTATTSQLERLLQAHEGLPFNGSGSMRAAFFRESMPDWSTTLSRVAADKKISLAEAEKLVRADRELEILGLLAWIRDGAKREPYDDDAFPLPAKLLPKTLGDRKVSNAFVETDDEGKTVVHIKKVLKSRCVRCHNPRSDSTASEAVLNTYETVKGYLATTGNGGGMSLRKLAQTTHVHLLGFAMLYCLTGLIFACSSYPGWLRVLLAPLPLLAQLADISCWWLARLDPLYARAILITGGIVAASLALQIVLGLLNLFGWTGRLVVILLLAAIGFGAFLLHERVIQPHLELERTGAVVSMQR
jgi:hypothetical protein